VDTPATITELLNAWSDGDKTALDALIPIVEAQLRRMAAKKMRGERSNHTLQTTALVNEAYLRLAKQNTIRWENRAHFFAIAAQIMRRILIDYAKARRSDKRGNAPVQVSLGEAMSVSTIDLDSLIAVDEALKKLHALDPIKSKVVELRHFGGLTVEESSDVLGIAQVTVMRHWSFAKSWLQKELRGMSA
jgi:RNA polymerase sigma-70 factor (ECF subfamily)